MRKRQAQDSGQGSRYIRQRYDENYRGNDMSTMKEKRRGIVIKADKIGYKSQRVFLTGLQDKTNRSDKTKIRTLEKLRDALLPKLMSG